MTPELESAQLTKMAYEKNDVKYTVYKGINRFNGTPIPHGYEAVYISSSGGIPDSLQLIRIKEK